MVKKRDKDTERAILAAAKQVFHEKGHAGARMQEIADAAGINKALLHYYFGNKEQLFKAVLQEAFQTIVPFVRALFSDQGAVLKKIEVFVEGYVGFLMENPFVPGFVVHELNTNPNFAIEFFSQHKIPKPKGFLEQIKHEVEAGRLRPIEPRQLLVNVISLCIFPFIASEIIKKATGMRKKEFDQFMVARKKEISRFVINAITPNETTTE